jgi:hypothetical protein
MRNRFDRLQVEVWLGRTKKHALRPEGASIEGERRKTVCGARVADKYPVVKNMAQAEVTCRLCQKVLSSRGRG